MTDWTGPDAYRAQLEAMAGAEPAFDVADAISRFAPEVHLHPEDSYRPASVDWFLDRTRMRLHRKFRRDVHALNRGEITRQTLTLVNLDETSSSGPAASNFFLQIPNDGAEEETREGDLDSAACYVHMRPVIGDADHFDIQYWFFYAYNGTADRHIGHEGDWEHVTVRLTDTAASELVRIYYSAHSPGDGAWVEPGEITFSADGRPIVYSSHDSHASYPNVGSHQRPGLKPSDTTAAHGPIWRTGESLVLAAVNGLPTAGNEWLGYSGRWGEIGLWWLPRHGHGPSGPPFQSSWYSE